MNTLNTRRQFLARMGTAASALYLGGCGQDETLLPTPARPDFYLGVGIENTWMVQADPTKDGPRRPLDEFALTGHDANWRADLTLAADLGVNCLRYSLPWPRVEAAPGVFEFSELRARLEFLVSLGITPILDLIHYGTPAWMQDGIGDPRFPESLSRYARATAEQLGGLVTHFTPYNEPQVAAALCGASGTWPPYAASPQAFAQLGARVARAMVLASQRLREVLSTAVLVSADPINWLLADTLFPELAQAEPEADELRAAVGSFPASLAYGKISTEHPLGALLMELGVAATEIDWLLTHAEPPDIVGYNHYPDIVNYPGSPDFTLGGSVPLARAATAAARHAEQGLRRAQGYFGGAIYLSETSAGLSSSARAAYATALGEMVERLQIEGFPLVGLNWWPLLQAVQWDYRDDVAKPLSDFFTPGGWNNALYDLVRKPDGTLQRVPTPAVAALRDLARFVSPPVR